MQDDNNKVILGGKNIIKKVYRCYQIRHIPYVQNLTYEKNGNCVKVDSYNIINDYNLEYKYDFVEGNIVRHINEELFSFVDKFISDVESISIHNKGIVTYFDKIEVYFNDIKYNLANKEKTDILLHLYKKFNDIKDVYSCDFLIHGDLDLSNIVESKDRFVVIDFDESCLAPKGMDWVIFITRLVLNIKNQKVKSEYAKEIILNEFKKIDINLVYLYVIKVIIEKVYFMQKEKINLDDKEQREDSYILWLSLLDEIEDKKLLETIL